MIDLIAAAAIFINAKAPAFGWCRSRKDFIIRQIMNCPHCQQVLPDEFSEMTCPLCGKDLPRENPKRMLFFFAVMLAPPVCCFIALALNLGFLATLFGTAGSMVSGLICSWMVMSTYKVSGLRRALLHVVIGVFACGLSFFLSFLGCGIASSVTGHGI